jgi:hypothetical protein
LRYTTFARIKQLCAEPSTPRQRGFPKNVLIRFFNFPLGTGGSSTAATTASKCSLRASPCSLILSMITEIGEELQAGNPRLVNERGGFERPAGKPPGGLEPPAITRAAWRFDTLTQRVLPYLLLCSGLGGRAPTGARCCRRGEIISRGHNGRSGWLLAVPTPSHAPR